MRAEDTTFKRMDGGRNWAPFKYLVLGLMALTSIFMVMTLITARTPYQEKAVFSVFDDGVTYQPILLNSSKAYAANDQTNTL